MGGSTLAPRLLAWFDRCGRTDLPWQRDRTPYRVWVSEIMLQQTQVQTVIPYFERFTARLPTVESLAAASEDEVLALWSGLGYYSRARNLHKASRLICEQHEGHLPEQLEGLTALPGIGRSTAGAILALARDQRHAILDGNVKRVLSRYHAVPGWPGKSKVEKRLWSLAEEHTPAERVADYTQAIMDLGATCCTRTRPACRDCPLNRECRAHGKGEVERYPEPRPRKTLPLRAATLLLATDPEERLLLVKRPPRGIWGGLWSLPELQPEQSLDDWCAARDLRPVQIAQGPVLRHTFSHFQLDIAPLHLRVEVIQPAAMAPGASVWYKSDQYNQLGLPAPIRRLVAQLNRSPTYDPHG